MREVGMVFVGEEAIRGLLNCAKRLLHLFARNAGAVDVKTLVQRFRARSLSSCACEGPGRAGSQARVRARRGVPHRGRHAVDAAADTRAGDGNPSQARLGGGGGRSEGVTFQKQTFANNLLLVFLFTIRLLRSISSFKRRRSRCLWF